MIDPVSEPLHEQVVILNGVRAVKNPGTLRCEQPNSLDPIIRTALSDSMGVVQSFLSASPERREHLP